MMYWVEEFDNYYQCNCRIQDGVERWTETSYEKAIQSLIEAARILNGTYITRDKIQFIKKYPLSVESADSILLDQIKRGEKIVLDFKDPRIKYNLTDEDCEIIVKIREGKLKVI